MVHGREDAVIPVPNSHNLEENVQNPNLSVYSHGGHWSMIERDADSTRLVRDVLPGS